MPIWAVVCNEPHYPPEPHFGKKKSLEKKFAGKKNLVMLFVNIIWACWVSIERSRRDVVDESILKRIWKKKFGKKFAGKNNLVMLVGNRIWACWVSIGRSWRDVIDYNIYCSFIWVRYFLVVYSLRMQQSKVKSLKRLWV